MMMVKNTTGLPLTNKAMTSTGKPFPSFEYELKPGWELFDDRYVSLVIIRSGVKDTVALERDGRYEHYLQTYRLVREDLLPYLESGRLEFGSLYMTDDQYRLTAKFLLLPEDGETPVEIVAKLRSSLEAAVYNGVQGSYDLLAVCLGDQSFAADNIATPKGPISIGARLEPIKIEEEVACFQLIDERERKDALLGRAYINEQLRQFPADSEPGKILRYGLLMGMQVARDASLRKIGALDHIDLRGHLLADLMVDPQGETIRR
jgi:hypothetical protein